MIHPPSAWLTRIGMIGGNTPVDNFSAWSLQIRHMSGACHIFRHTMATLMLERGADIRIIQEILGHEELSTTEIYTRVSIAYLKAVHDRTHPGAKLEPSRPTPATERDSVDDGASS